MPLELSECIGEISDSERFSAIITNERLRKLLIEYWQNELFNVATSPERFLEFVYLVIRRLGSACVADYQSPKEFILDPFGYSNPIYDLYQTRPAVVEASNDVRYELLSLSEGELTEIVGSVNSDVYAAANNWLKEVRQKREDDERSKNSLAYASSGS